MIEILNRYSSLVDEVAELIENSKFKREHFLNELNISRTTFYHKLKRKTFSLNELYKIGAILFPEEYKDFEIQQGILKGLDDVSKGRVKSHSSVMSNARKRINEWQQ